MGTIKADSTVLASDFVFSATAGEALSANDAVYISGADGKAYKTDADDAAKVGFRGFAQEAVAANGSVNIINHGLMTGLSGLTVGADYFLSSTAGAITSSPPTVSGSYVVLVGVALSATVLLIRTGLSKNEPVVRVYTSDDTWTKPNGLRYLEVEVVGGGGGGGSGSSTSVGGGGGGGGGGYSRKKLNADEVGATVAVTVGSGGAGGSDGAGGTGVTSSFGAFLSAAGGVGGNKSASGQVTGGAGGLGSGGDINVVGQAGSNGFNTGGNSMGGVGGASHLGGGGKSPGGNGEAGGAYGGGGGAGIGADSDVGGAGAAGVVIVREYYW